MQRVYAQKESIIGAHLSPNERSSMAKECMTRTTYRCHVVLRAAENAASVAAAPQGTRIGFAGTKVAEVRPRLEPVDRGAAAAPGEDCVIGGLVALDPFSRQED